MIVLEPKFIVGQKVYWLDIPSGFDGVLGKWRYRPKILEVIIRDIGYKKGKVFYSSLNLFDEYEEELYSSLQEARLALMKLLIKDSNKIAIDIINAEVIQQR